MIVRATILAVTSGLLSVSFCIGQQTSVEKVPIRHTSPSAGQDMYVTYCAACHGKDGKGDGPAASALKVTPADLTALAKNNNGVFPRDRVYGTIKGDVGVSAHGSKEMPVWGRLFRSVDNNNALTLLRLKNLTDYIESLQVKK